MKKYLTDRKEIALALNFGKYPVLRIDVETEMKGYPNCYKGDLVRVSSANSVNPEHCIRATLESFPEDGGKYAIMPASVCLHSDFGYSDVIEEMRYAQAPLIRAGETVVVIEDYPQRKKCKVHMMKVSDSVRDHVFPTCYLEELPEG